MSKSTGNGRATSLFLVLLWLALGVTPILSDVTDLRLAFGLIGEPGRVAVTGCTDLGEGRYDCRGVFVPDDPQGRTVRNLKLPPESDAGETFEARLQPDGERAHPTGTKGQLNALALPFLGFAMLVPLPWLIAYMFWGRSPGRASWWVMGVLAGLGCLGCLAGLIAAY
ncbi:hypothetical protein SAMN04489712_104521 [Thermomonospora echinospora]|uniref:Uncharacterized protein n=1 Tax=Thermomonospora echinospora TaxID=1992 RepID=A0A1H5ZF19_9ACTN|nr:hypothetical protein [Thermomonospora echinospora]SEG34892.1 hypothetical protein SAMN04489712_104521 [Thermomonospora echinospora]